MAAYGPPDWHGTPRHAAMEPRLTAPHRTAGRRKLSAGRSAALQGAACLALKVSRATSMVCADSTDKVVKGTEGNVGLATAWRHRLFIQGSVRPCAIFGARIRSYVFRRKSLKRGASIFILLLIVQLQCSALTSDAPRAALGISSFTSEGFALLR